jgi:hypothetical protein
LSIAEQNQHFTIAVEDVQMNNTEEVMRSCEVFFGIQELERN